jgi:hypothetical protein
LKFFLKSLTMIVIESENASVFFDGLKNWAWLN